MFADDNFPLASNTNLNTLISEFETKLATIKKWLMDSGLKINETKTDLCLFHRNDHEPVFNAFKIKCKQIFLTMN